MPRYIPSMPFEDCYGSIGDKTYYHRNGVCYSRRRSRPAFPGTMSQVEHLSVHLRALESWRQLSPAIQKSWNTCATGVVSHRPPFDGKSGINGHNLFVSAYHGLASLGNEHTPKPLSWEEFPPYALESVAGAMVEDGMLLLDFNLWMDESAEKDRYQVLARLQLAKPGGGRNPGKMRSFLSLIPCECGQCMIGFAIPDYIDLWGLDLPEYTIHIRHVLLDRHSGYRSQFRQQSFDFNIP